MYFTVLSCSIDCCFCVVLFAKVSKGGGKRKVVGVFVLTYTVAVLCPVLLTTAPVLCCLLR
jgi:hypothetical protein